MFEVRTEWSGTSDAARRASPWYGVHAARYAFAASFAGKKRVLDVACGTGGGLRILSEAGARVIAVDFDKTAVAKARASSGGAALVLVGSASELPFGRGAGLDVVRDTGAPRGESALLGGGAAGAPSERGTSALYSQREPHTADQREAKEPPPRPRVHARGAIARAQRSLSRRQRPGPDPPSKVPSPTFPRSAAGAFSPRRPTDGAVRLARDQQAAHDPREWTSRLLWRRVFPGESDYEFSPATVDWAPVLLAICRPERPRPSG